MKEGGKRKREERRRVCAAFPLFSFLLVSISSCLSFSWQRQEGGRKGKDGKGRGGLMLIGNDSPVATQWNTSTEMPGRQKELFIFIVFSLSLPFCGPVTISDRLSRDIIWHHVAHTTHRMTSQPANVRHSVDEYTDRALVNHVCTRFLTECI